MEHSIFNSIFFSLTVSPVGDSLDCVLSPVTNVLKPVTSVVTPVINTVTPGDIRYKFEYQRIVFFLILYYFRQQC